MLHTRRQQANNCSFECIVGITVTFRGESQCSFPESIVDIYRPYTGYDKYFENSQTVFGGTGKLISILKILTFILHALDINMFFFCLKSKDATTFHFSCCPVIVFNILFTFLDISPINIYICMCPTPYHLQLLSYLIHLYMFRAFLTHPQETLYCLVSRYGEL
jgi:hypothetical protein